MSFVKRWAHEIAVVVMAVWAAVGVSGQQGIFNLAANVIASHKWPAAVLAVLSIVTARLRTSPLAPEL